MAKAESADATWTPEFLRTHPASTNRLELIKEWVVKYKEERAIGGGERQNAEDHVVRWDDKEEKMRGWGG